jgi:hypothetical protein
MYLYIRAREAMDTVYDARFEDAGGNIWTQHVELWTQHISQPTIMIDLCDAFVEKPRSRTLRMQQRGLVLGLDPGYIEIEVRIRVMYNKISTNTEMLA